MFIQVVRTLTSRTSTVGVMYINGEFECFTLEDGFNKVKIAGSTRIPAGEYEIKFRNEGSMTGKYANKYSNHEGMLWLQDVPNFKYIYIHTGNTDDDTEGCILVGKSCDTDNGTIGKSRKAYIELYPKIAAAIHRGEEVTIQII